MTNILVTGGAGYIGSHTALALANAGFTPVTFDNFSCGNRWAVQWGPLVEGDIADTDLLVKTIEDFDIRAVLHFAAFTVVGESMTNPAKYFRNNVNGLLSLAEAMRLTDRRQLVFSSTCATYGMPDIVPITETESQTPVNTYGESKLMAERILRWYDQIFSLKCVALRYFNASGADAENRIGEAHLPETHLIPLILDSILGRRKHIDVYGQDYPTPDGTAIRDYIHVTDLADAHVRSLSYLLDGGDSIAINLGTGRGYSVYEVIDSVERVTGRKVPKRDVERRAGDPPELIADPSLGRTVLGWQARMSDIDTIVETAWRWHQRLTAEDFPGTKSS